MYPYLGYIQQMNRVDLSKVHKQLKKVPHEIILRLQRWIRTVEEFGLIEARKVKGTTNL